MLVVVCLLAAARLASAERSGDFPVPPALAPAVAFWTDVFARYSGDQVVLHDRLEPGLVYEVIRPGDGPAAAIVLEKHVQAIMDGLALSRVWGPDSVTRLLLADPARRAAEPLGRERIRAQRGMREAFAASLEAERMYRPVVLAALAREGVPSALAAVPLIESSYHPGAVSQAGAVGLWQLSRDTGQKYLRIAGTVDERSDPVRASEAAARHLRELREALPNWPLALTAYNRGRSGVEQARRAVGSDDLGVLVTRYRGPGFGFASRSFYAEFLAALHVMRSPRHYFPDLALRRTVEYRVKRGDTLSAVARRYGVSATSLRVANGMLSASLRPGQRLLVRL
jgi:membrane-bound lytic murein transglycosylase D